MTSELFSINNEVMNALANISEPQTSHEDLKHQEQNQQVIDKENSSTSSNNGNNENIFTEEKEINNSLHNEVDVSPKDAFQFNTNDMQWDKESGNLENQDDGDIDEDEDDDDEDPIIWIKEQLGLSHHSSMHEEDVEDEDMTEDEMAKSMHEALTLLNSSGMDLQMNNHKFDEYNRVDTLEESNTTYNTDTWTRPFADAGETYYYDFEATVEDTEKQDESMDKINNFDAEQDNQLEDIVKDSQEHQVNPEQMNQQEPEDVWQEAFSAKGRPYYYNRFTRESTWTKPEGFQSSASNSTRITPSSSFHGNQSGIGKQSWVSSFVNSSVQDQIENNITSNLMFTESKIDPTLANIRNQSHLFCCFCGFKQSAESLVSHFKACAVLNFHKQTRSELHSQFTKLLCILSEDDSLRSLHYASSFLDATPPNNGSKSIQEHLRLLQRRKQKHQKKRLEKSLNMDAPSTRQYGDSSRKFVSQIPKRSTNYSSDINKRATQNGFTVTQVNKASRYHQAKNNPSAELVICSETCRYCGRSFAQGRLAKHEAVCPRVFGNEASWGKGMTPERTRKSPINSKSNNTVMRKGKNTLALSFRDHQARLIVCPSCNRKFAPSGAQQHIEICKTVQNRPKNTIPLLKDYAIAS